LCANEIISERRNLLGIKLPSVQLVKRFEKFSSSVDDDDDDDDEIAYFTVR